MDFFADLLGGTIMTTSALTNTVHNAPSFNRVPTKAIHESIFEPPPPLLYSNPQPRDAMHNQIEPPKDVEDYMSYTSGNLAYVFHATLDEIKDLEKTFNSFISKKSFDSKVLGYSCSKGFGSAQALSNDNDDDFDIGEGEGNGDLQAAFQQTPKEREKLIRKIESSDSEMGGLLRGERWSGEAHAPERLQLSAMRFYGIKKLVDVFDPRGMAKTFEDMRRAEKKKKKLEKAKAKAEGQKVPKELKREKSRRFVYDSEDEVNGHLIWTRKNRLMREERVRGERRDELVAMLRKAEQRRRKTITLSIRLACLDADEKNAEGRFSDLLETESDRKLAEHWLKIRCWDDEENGLEQAVLEIDNESFRCSAELWEEEGRRITSFLPKTTQSTTSCHPSPPQSPADSVMCLDEDTTDVAMTENCAPCPLAAKSSSEPEGSESKECRKIPPFPFNAIVKAARLRGKAEDGKTAEEQYDELVSGPGMAGSNLDLDMCF